MSEQPVTWRWK